MKYFFSIVSLDGNNASAFENISLKRKCENGNLNVLFYYHRSRGFRYTEKIQII